MEKNNQKICYRLRFYMDWLPGKVQKSECLCGVEGAGNQKPTFLKFYIPLYRNTFSEEDF